MRLAAPPLLALPAGGFPARYPSPTFTNLDPNHEEEKLSSSFTGGVHATSMVLAPVLPPPSMRAAKTSMAKYGKTWFGTPIATKQHCNTKSPCELMICDYTVIDYISIMICSGFAAKAHAINFLLIGFLFLSCYMLLRKCCLHTARLMTSV